MAGVDPMKDQQLVEVTPKQPSPKRRRLLSTRKLAGASVASAGLCGFALAPAAFAHSSIYCLDQHRAWPYDCSGPNSAHVYQSQAGFAWVSHAGNVPAIHGGRPVIAGINSAGHYWSTAAINGSNVVYSFMGGTRKKTLFCGPFSTNAYYLCSGRW